MSQETITEILAIEQEAVQAYRDAQSKAARVIEEARRTSSSLRDETISQARQEAETIRAEGQREADAERARIIEQAEADAREMEMAAAQHFDRAERFVLERVAGHA